MHIPIRLTLLERGDVVDEYVFSRPTRFIVGRAGDCDVCVPSDFLHQDVSRHHCAFEIDPPFVRVSDLHSLNGTFVNGTRISEPGDQPSKEEPANESLATVELHSGDEVQFGRCSKVLVSDLLPREYVLQEARGATERDGEEGSSNDCYH